MPINELEQHPYLDYVDDNEVSHQKYKGLIIGSFPIYACTDSIDSEHKVIKSRFDRELTKMRFFYGSKKSKFWHYLSSAFGNSIEHNIDSKKAIEFLKENNLIITDVLFRVNRKKTSAADTDLWIENEDLWLSSHLSLNHSIKTILDNNKSIDNLFFTSQEKSQNSPFGWFKQIYGKNFQELENKEFGTVCMINNKKFNCFFLPTPKPRALHFTDKQKTVMFMNFMESKDKKFYEEVIAIKKIDRTSYQTKKISDFRVECLVEAYRQALVYNNINFDGTTKTVDKT